MTATLTLRLLPSKPVLAILAVHDIFFKQHMWHLRNTAELLQKLEIDYRSTLHKNK